MAEAPVPGHIVLIYVHLYVSVVSRVVYDVRCKGSSMIEGALLKPLKVWADDRGYFCETVREDDPYFTHFGQSAITMSYPGVIKAFHWHENQDDYWVVVKGMAQVVLHDMRASSPTRGQTDVYYLGEQNMQLLVIPRGVAHG